ncbi:MAG: cytochrome ubiquinol oxidase subunit I [Porphyromonadaceae bacterium]|nr:cytochrome ubiquinol oxidase subunit I [Porphyromonadaceae bacterium]
MHIELDSLMAWSRAQFALTAMYHWLFVPLTLGLGIIMSLVETKYYRTGEEFWKKSAKFWQKLFGINFAIGVATGIILEFQFGTNWSNYSTFVGDIFGAPLAIEGILAFFMESTFIAVMFFGWDKVSKKFHLASTWLTIIGATISAIWILVANAWMQHPTGMVFNPETMRSEMNDFWAVALSSTAMTKFWHTVISSWTLGALFAAGVCAYYALRRKNLDFVQRNMKIIAPFGLVAAILTGATGHTSAVDVATHQPMKLAAMEALYDAGSCDGKGGCASGEGIGLSAFGILNPSKQNAHDGVEPYLFNIEAPRVLSYMVSGNGNTYIPGIKNILDGGYYLPNGEKALSVEEKMARGRTAIGALKEFSQAKSDKNEEVAAQAKSVFDENFPYFGYGFFEDKYEVVPPVSMVYYSFRIMVGLGMLFILLFALLTWVSFMGGKKGLSERKPLIYLALACTPLAWVASQSGWIVAEVGRQPWTIQDLLPVRAALSHLETWSVITTFTIFLVLFTAMLIAELNIMRKAIQNGPDAH